MLEVLLRDGCPGRGCIGGYGIIVVVLIYVVVCGTGSRREVARRRPWREASVEADVSVAGVAGRAFKEQREFDMPAGSAGADDGVFLAEGLVGVATGG